MKFNKAVKYSKLFIFPFILLLNGSVSSALENEKNLKFFENVFDRIKAYYVEEKSEKELIEAALNGILTSLDPHSSYLDEKAFDEMRMQTKGEFGGLGLEVTASNGLVKIISPIDDTPAFEAGIKAGDSIIAIDDQMVVGMNLNEAVEKMRGKVGTKVKLTVLREGTGEPLEFTLTRAIIKVNPVKSIDYDDIAYVRVSTFSEGTATSVKKELDKFNARKDKKLHGVILDLRNNGGGLLDQAIELSDLFLESGQIVSTKGRIPESLSSFSASGTKSGYHDIPLIVLVNAGSASASEIVAGALQDNNRAILVGTKTFGKGSVQNVIPLSNNGAMKITTALYYTPSGKSIQAEGIVPDINVELAKIEFFNSDQHRTFSESSLKNHIGNADKASENKTQVINANNRNELEKELYSKDYQLARAVDLLKSILILERNKKLPK